MFQWQSAELVLILSCQLNHSDAHTFLPIKALRLIETVMLLISASSGSACEHLGFLKDSCLGSYLKQDASLVMIFYNSKCFLVGERDTGREIEVFLCRQDVRQVALQGEAMDPTQGWLTQLGYLYPPGAEDGITSITHWVCIDPNTIVCPLPID